MKTCSVNVRKSKNNTCLCTKKLCAKSKCSVLKKDCNHLTVTCKMDTVPVNHDDCLTSSVTDELTGKRIQRTRCTFMNHKKTLRNQTKYEKPWYNIDFKKLNSKNNILT